MLVRRPCFGTVKNLAVIVSVEKAFGLGKGSVGAQHGDSTDHSVLTTIRLTGADDPWHGDGLVLRGHPW